MTQLQCILVTPETTAIDRPADFVALPLFDGEIGIAPGHSPMIGRLGFGELRLVEGGGTDRFYIEGGFVEVIENVVSILTARALPAAQVDATQAHEQLATARSRVAVGEEAIALRDRLEAQSRAQLRVARRSH